MKKIALLTVGVLVCSFAFATPNEDEPRVASGVVVLKQNDYSFRVIYKSVEKSDVKVEITDVKGEVVFKETIKGSDGFVRPYNLANLSEGDYTIRVDNGLTPHSKQVHNGGKDSEKAAQLVHLKDGRYLLAVAGKGTAKLDINIFDSQGSLVRKDTQMVDGNFARIYNLDRVKGTSFTFEVKDDQGASKILQKE